MINEKYISQISKKYAILYLKNNDFHKFNLVNMNKSPSQFRTYLSLQQFIASYQFGFYQSNTYTKKPNHKKLFKKPIKQTNKQANKQTNKTKNRKKRTLTSASNDFF